MFGPGRQQFITSRIPALRKNISTWESERTKVDRNIERLEQARSQIQKIIDNSRSLPNNIRNRPGQRVPTTSFRGSNQRLMSEVLGEMRDTLNTQRNGHEMNISTIRSRITSLQGNRMTLTSNISVANNEITRLQQEWLIATGTSFPGW